jgi:hypothetical protein
VTLAALAYAALTKRWRTECEASYLHTELVRKTASERVAGEIARLQSIPNPYERLAGFVALRADERRNNKDLVGVRYDIELALFDAFDQAGRKLVYEIQRQRSDDAERLRPPLSPDIEREIHCLANGKPAFIDPPATLPLAYVRIPVDEARVKSLIEIEAAQRDLVQKLPSGDREDPIPLIDSFDAPPPGTLVLVERSVHGAPLKIKKIEPEKDGKLTVILEGNQLRKQVEYDCRAPAGFEKMTPEEVDLKKICKTRDELRQVSVTARFTSWPGRPGMEVGDQLFLLAKVVKADTQTRKVTPRLELQTVYEVEVVHLVEIWRDTLLLANHFVE